MLDGILVHMQNNKPKISVLMSIYREPIEWIRASIDSILKQSYKNIELIAVLDSPDYEGNQIVFDIASQDDRIKIVKNEENKGLTKSLIHAMGQAQGSYIARMDADDIAEPNRFERQLKYMEEHPNVSVVGSYVDVFREDGSHQIGMNNLDSDQENNRIRMLFCNAGVVHSTALMRKSFLDEYHISYDPKMKKSQDYGLWVDIVSAGGEIQIIPEILLRYRVHGNQITNRNSDEQRRCYAYAINKQIERLGIVLSEDELDLHLVLHNYRVGINPNMVWKHVLNLIEANDHRGIYDKKKFRSITFSFYLHYILKEMRTQKKSDYIRLMWRVISCKTLKTLCKVYISDKKYRRVLSKYLAKKSS